MTDEFGPLRQRLAESLTAQGAFREPWIRGLLDAVARHDFAPDTVWTWQEERWRPLHRADAPEQWSELVYHADDALVTQVDDGRTADDGSGRIPTSSMSSAGAVVNMLASLDPAPNHRVLEIGTGTGYNAALLCERVGAQRVVTVEVDADVVRHARRRLAACGYGPEVIHGDGLAGAPDHAPFDRLIATAAAREIPAAWLEQMTPDGELVVPWLPNDQGLGLLWLRMREPGVARGYVHGAETFMAIRAQRHERPDLAGIWRATRDDAREDQQHQQLPALDVHGEFVLAACLPGVSAFQEGDGWFFLTGDRRSWARVDSDSALLYGPRDLIAEVRAALAWWEQHNRPRLFDFGATVTADGPGTRLTLWLGEDRTPVPTWPR
ncbi:methyltransferase domain-containing protein [Streptomyces sp. BPTC-684]|uniref:methyltransferase domain-containing protein n=1 Tax=Streptomyces sp. BPTC-684 TaxID=3043734 RepID=UPI0024B1BFC6|nr:methyltransferase domain-containing protein [Streptomyces sp. BPTC-684]WHM36602.1 methyltransferase domain-containing protein [Streptomyces sp. BPTC-684]